MLWQVCCMTLGKPFCWLRLGYLHLQNRAQSLLHRGCDTRRAQVTLCRWEGVSLLAHAAAHPDQCVLVISALHQGSWNCSGAPPELGLCASAMSRQSTEPGLSVQAGREGTHPVLWRQKRLTLWKQTLTLFIYSTSVSSWDWHWFCGVPLGSCAQHEVMVSFGAFQTPYRHCWHSGCPEGESRLSMLVYN